MIVPPDSIAVPPDSIAVPSWVLPGDVLENCRFLAHAEAAQAMDVAEVGICLFESAACLDYPAATWEALAALPLRYHLHLPLDLDDLPTATLPADPAAVCLQLLHRARPLRPWACVVHPFQDPARLRRVVTAWTAAGLPSSMLLLENIPAVPLESVVALAYELDMGLCLDLGHLLLSGETPDAAALARCGMLHLSCPEPRGAGHRHLPLDRLDAAGDRLARALLTGAPQARRMVEVFDWAGVVSSIRWLQRAGQGKAG